VLSSAPATIHAYLQLRADGQGLSDALENGRKIKIGSAVMEPDVPLRLDFDFDSPRNRARSLRVLLEMSGSDSAVEIEIDDLKLIEWQSPFGDPGGACSN